MLRACPLHQCRVERIDHLRPLLLMVSMLPGPLHFSDCPIGHGMKNASPRALKLCTGVHTDKPKLVEEEQDSDDDEDDDPHEPAGSGLGNSNSQPNVLDLRVLMSQHPYGCLSQHITTVTFHNVAYVQGWRPAAVRRPTWTSPRGVPPHARSGFHLCQQLRQQNSARCSV